MERRQKAIEEWRKEAIKRYRYQRTIRLLDSIIQFLVVTIFVMMLSMISLDF